MTSTMNPYIILSAAMTIDGKIATVLGDPELSDEEDWKEVHKLRTQVDAIMVGKGTILKDNPKLHIKYHEHNGYYRIVLDSNLAIPIDSNVVNYQPEVYPTIICVNDNVDQEKVKKFESKKAKIIKSGSGNQVDIPNLLAILYDLGIKSILLEGGGNLNWSFIRDSLVDELRLTVAPCIVGGKDAITLVEGDGFGKMIEAPRFKLKEVRNRENYVILKYTKK